MESIIETEFLSSHTVALVLCSGRKRMRRGAVTRDVWKASFHLDNDAQFGEPSKSAQ